MPRLIWSPAALLDVQRLYRFLAPKNQDAARRAVQAIRTGVGVLRDHPRMGRPAEEMDPEFREWVIEFGRDGYVVLYRLDADDVVLLAIRHGPKASHSDM